MVRQFAVLEVESYFGGKGASGTFQKIINQIPPHNTFISGCLGCCAVMRFKKPAVLNVGFDLNGNIIEAWQNAQFPESGLSLQNLRLHQESFINSPTVAELVNDETFIYLDPPYPLESRKSNRLVYDFEMSDRDHIELLKFVKTLPCKVAISTYPNSIYEQHLKDWRLLSFQSNTRQGLATEYLYMNYSEPEKLHDYSFLGDNYKSREHIKLKFKSMIRKIKGLPTLQRNMILDYLVKEYDLKGISQASQKSVIGHAKVSAEAS